MPTDDALFGKGTAKEALDETSGVTLSLTTQELPEGVDGVLGHLGNGSGAGGR